MTYVVIFLFTINSRFLYEEGKGGAERVRGLSRQALKKTF